ncbi:GTP:AMP phosphotransferase ak3, mitochondrial [Entophlyctis luteolus]|nr:GTP:AMP phosphotransferase ak3, mitochondrial [Entophlyctis luteolus]KAJ3380114.1 GTP:AMP phosphotransferase ak3, mitochondrial [Entophlyctis sp. JEL0112]
MRTLVFFGAPGSGKGTLAARFSQHHGLAVLSTGDVLRSHVHNRTQIGKRIADVLARGELVDDAIVADLMDYELHKASSSRISLLLDGFPRSVPQVHGLDDVTGEKLTKRADDNLDTFKNRITHFKTTTAPILDYYSQKGLLSSFKGETSDQLFPQINASFGHMFK